MFASTRAKVVVITGASGGVGRAAACAFAKRGAHIALLARGEAGLEGARRDVEALGGKALVVPTDVSDPEQVEQAAQIVEEHFGPIDIWTNDAFCSVFSPAKEMTPDDYKRVTEVSYLGFVYGTLAAMKRMLPRDHGTIVQVGSALAYRGIPLQSAYCAAKHAIQGFTESVRCELIHDRSRVKITMVQMPALNTPQFSWSKNRMPRKAQPVPPIYQPEVAAEAIVWAAHHYRREWYVGGSTAVVIAGNKMFPGLGDYYLGWNGYESQMRREAEDPNRPDNLYEPVDQRRDFGAHGAFDGRSVPYSAQLWIDQNCAWLALGSVFGAFLGTMRSEHGHGMRGSIIGSIVGALGAGALAAISGGVASMATRAGSVLQPAGQSSAKDAGKQQPLREQQSSPLAEHRHPRNRHDSQREHEHSVSS
jgi:NAD(P)-dependent dehydrogenase (short-subunit alcohol dehydrogenase family)